MSEQQPRLADLPPDIVRGAEVLATHAARGILFLAVTFSEQQLTTHGQSKLINDLQGEVPGWYLKATEMDPHSDVLKHADLFEERAVPKKMSNATVAAYRPNAGSEKHIATAGILLDGELTNTRPYRDLLVDPRPSTGKPGATSLAWNMYDELLRVPPFTLSSTQLATKLGATIKATIRTINALKARGSLRAYDRTDITQRLIELRQPSNHHFMGSPLSPAFAITMTTIKLRDRGITRLTIHELIEAVVSNPTYAYLEAGQVHHAITGQTGSITLLDLDEKGDANNRRRTTLAINPAMLGAVEELVMRLCQLHNPDARQGAERRAKEIIDNPFHTALLMAKARGGTAVKELMDARDARATNQAIIDYSRAQRTEFEAAAAQLKRWQTTPSY